MSSSCVNIVEKIGEICDLKCTGNRSHFGPVQARNLGTSAVRLAVRPTRPCAELMVSVRGRWHCRAGGGGSPLEVRMPSQLGPEGARRDRR
mmetsp:Transcript_62965/g.205517  ORF Transcript_62965/g.205517 Transcript_62965/m.205517 type:complete len:91 (+) Transcript_62965:619-891(+)